MTNSLSPTLDFKSSAFGFAYGSTTSSSSRGAGTRTRSKPLGGSILAFGAFAVYCIMTMTRMDLIRAGPYRIFFPLGVLAGLIGVGHWLFWSVGWLQESDPFFHALIQVEGFLSCFVAGFLTTAFPRFLGAPPASNKELAVTWGLEFSVIVLLIEKQFAAAQVGFLAMLVSLIVFAARRLPRRTKSPPTSFLLIGFGLLQALAGPAIMLATHFGQRSYAWMESARQMLQIGFMLCLVLGIAGYLAPFLMGYAADPSCDPGISPIRGAGRGPLLFHGLTGACIALSFLAMTVRGAQAAAFVRAGAALAQLVFFAKIARFPRQHRTYIYFFWIACWMVVAGLMSAAIWPDLRIASLHLVFIGGFSLMIFSFGLLVVLSHAAQADLLNTRLFPLRIVGVAVLAAMALRVTADLDAWNNRAWLHAASGTWVLAAALWLIYVFPKLFRIPPVMTEGYRTRV